MPLRSWIAPLYVLAEHRAGHSTIQAGSAALRRSGNIIICTFKLRLDVWFFPSDSACISRPSSACCLCSTLCMHYMHAHTHALQSSVIGHLRPGHNTIVYKKCLVHIYTAVTWATLLSLSWRECIHFTRKLSSFLVCCIHNAVIRCNFLCAPPGLPCEVLHSL